jgi:tRNA(Ile2) C34 agmatinyltransferase TiaS
MWMFEGVGMAESEESVEKLFEEIDKATMTGVCPHCGCALESFKDADASGLRCLKCHWEASFPNREKT